MEFTTVIAAPAIVAMQERSDLQEKGDLSRTRQYSLHPMQENLLESLFSIESKSEGLPEASHPNPMQQKLMRRLFSSTRTKTMYQEEQRVASSDPRPLRQQPEPKVKISLRRRITDSADLTWQCEMSEEGPFVFEEVL